METVMWVVVGLIAGWFGGTIMTTKGYGPVGDVTVGLIGALVGAWLLAFALPEAERGGTAGLVVAAAFMAALFIAVARLFTRRTARA